MHKKWHAIFFTDMNNQTWHARPLGAYRLASELRSKGYSVLVVEYFSRWIKSIDQLKELLNIVISDQTVFVGYSGTFFSIDNYVKNPRSYAEYYSTMMSHWPAHPAIIKKINDHIRHLRSEIKIFYGGAQADNLTDDLRRSGVDYVVQGLADGVLVDLMRRLVCNEFIPYTPKNGVRVIDYDVKGLTFDFPNSFTEFCDSDCLDQGEIIPIETSRGCLFKCSFCSYPLLGRKKNDPDYHKNVSVLEKEFRNNYERWGITRYMFVDDTFNESTAKLQDIKQAIDASGIQINFSCYLRLDLLSRFPEQIELLKSMGIQSCLLGIETLNKTAAQAIGKKSDIGSVKNALQMIRHSWQDQVMIFASFIAGLPGENKHTIDQWMNWVYERSDLIDSFRLHPLQISRTQSHASEISREPEKYGYIVNHGYRWINNVGYTFQESQQISSEWMELSWKTSRLRVAPSQMLGMQSLGYDYQDVKKIPLNQLPYQKIGEQEAAKFSAYQQKLMSYITQ